MSRRHPSTLNSSYVMSHTLSPPSADTLHHPSASYHPQGTHPTYHALSPSRGAPKSCSASNPSRVTPIVSGRKRGRSTEEDQMGCERPVFGPKPTSHRRTVSMTTSGKQSALASVPTESHPLWFSTGVDKTSPQTFTYPFMGCLLRSPLPAPPLPPSCRSSSRQESLSPTQRMTDLPSKNRIVQSSGQKSAFIQRGYDQNLNPGQSPERHLAYERNRSSVPGLMNISNTAPQAGHGLCKDPRRTYTDLDSHHPYPSPPKSWSDRSSVHKLDHSPQSSTAALPRSSPLFMFDMGDQPLPPPSTFRRQPGNGLAHSRPLENSVPSNSKRRRTASYSSVSHPSSSSRVSTRINRASGIDHTSRNCNKHRALPPLKPCSPPSAKSTSFSTDPLMLSSYKMNLPNKATFSFPSAILPSGSKVTTERSINHRFDYPLPQVCDVRRRASSNSNACSGASGETSDLIREHRPGQESPRDVCLPSFELLLNGIQEMRMREQSGGSTGINATDAV